MKLVTRTATRNDISSCASASRKEAEKLIALGYDFHYHTADGVDLFRKKVIGLD
jgi:hypothetical protein